MTAQAIARLWAALDGWRAARRKQRALSAFAEAVRLDAQTVIEVALAATVRAGFTLSKDGQEYAVLVGGKRIEPAE